jgi:hypothetical protein
MKKTTAVYLTEWTSEDICDNCKHGLKTLDQEPCKSCVISNWEPIEESKP